MGIVRGPGQPAEYARRISHDSRLLNFRALGDDQGISLQQDVHNLLGVEPEEQEGEDPTTEMHVKYNVLLHGKRTKAAQKSVSGGLWVDEGCWDRLQCPGSRAELTPCLPPLPFCSCP